MSAPAVLFYSKFRRQGGGTEALTTVLVLMRQNLAIMIATHLRRYPYRRNSYHHTLCYHGYNG